MSPSDFAVKHSVVLLSAAVWPSIHPGDTIGALESAETSMEIFVFARLHARPGKQGEVYEAMHEVQGPTREEPGCLSYGGFRSVRDPDEFYIHSRWTDLAAFERHASLPHTVRFLEAVEPLLDHPFGTTLAERLW